MVSTTRRPSPAMIVAALALVFAMVGTAVAGTDGVGKLTKSSVRKIAKKQADKELRKNVAGSHVNTADTATSAQVASGLTGNEAYRIIGAAGQPTFLNGWHNIEMGIGPAGFYIDKQNEVHLTGAVTGGATLDPAFTLPDGYRPATSIVLPAASSDTPTAFLRIDPTGNVRPGCSPSCTGIGVGFTGVSFRVGTGGLTHLRGRHGHGMFGT